MNTLFNFWRQWRLPPVTQILKDFQDKIDLLNERVDLAVDEINAADVLMESLYDHKQCLLAEISVAEKAVEALEKITG